MTPRFGMLPKVITLIPLAALSVVGAVQVARTPSGDVSATVGRTSDQVTTSTPAPSTTPAPPASALVVPSAGQAPASVSRQVRPAASDRVVPAAALAAPAIPALALAAYQRAATVIDTADASCHLDWSLIAAIGRVESDHGTHAGSRLDAAGHAAPAIVGPRLNGRNRTMRVADTDGGLLDGDARFDHAVGPMQFLPSTWATVGVDADGDGQRDPQDIDDAALAAAVYLCSGAEDLSAVSGRQTALLRYNHSASYVDTVLHVAGAYQAGAGVDAAVPAFMATRTAAVPAVAAPAVVTTAQTAAVVKGHRRHRHPAVVATALAGHPHHAQAVAGHGAVPSPAHAGQPVVAPPSSGQPTPSQPPATDPPTPTDPPASGQPGGSTPPVVTATAEQLTALCTERIEKAYPEATVVAHDQAVKTCTQKLDGTTLDEATAQVDDLVAALPDGTDGTDAIDGLVPAAPPSAGPTPTDPAPTTDPSASDPSPTDPSAPQG